MSLNIPQKRIENLKTELDKKQNKLVAGTGITIDNTDPESPIISSEGIRGTINYSELENQPTINAVTLNGNKTAKDLSLFDKTTLIAGKNVTIDEVLPEGGIDNHTLACFHFEDVENTAENSATTGVEFTNNSINTARATVDYGSKFGSGALRSTHSNAAGYFQNLTDGIANSDFTVDFWVKWGSSSGRAAICTEVYSNDPRGRGVIFWDKQINLPNNSGSATSYINNITTFKTAYNDQTWYHCAYVQDGLKYRAYIDGIQIASGEYTALEFTKKFYIFVWGNVLIDELRVSDIVRYTENFTPLTQPYSVAEPTGKYAINATAEPYNLPIASSDTLGGIKPGTGVEVTPEGVLNNAGYSSNDFTNSFKEKLNNIEDEATKVLVDGITIIKDDNNVISVNPSSIPVGFQCIFRDWSEETTPDNPNTPTEGTVLYENYTANNTGFSTLTDIDWNTQKIIAKIDTTNQTGTLANIFSVGGGIDGWNNRKANFHLYYTKSENLLRLDASSNTSYQSITYKEITLDSTTLNIEISKENGVIVNGTSMNYDRDNAPVVSSTFYADMWGLTEIEVGAKQGGTLSTSTYEYIKVVPI